MKLAAGEKKIGEFYLKRKNDVENMCILTDRRLLIMYKNAEESYPLSKITAVKLFFKRSWVLIIAGILFIISALGAFSNDNMAGTMLLVLGGGLAVLGWRGKTHLVISHMSGVNAYKVRGRGRNLYNFMEAVNSMLS